MFVKRVLGLLCCDCYWWSGSLRSQVICSYGIDYVGWMDQRLPRGRMTTTSVISASRNDTNYKNINYVGWKNIIEVEWRIYMHQQNKPSLIQIMVCRLLGAKPLSEPMLGHCNRITGKMVQWNFDKDSNIFIWETSFQNFFGKMVATLSEPWCVNILSIPAPGFPDPRLHRLTFVIISA